jgi:septal ring factor EnvC (AmiA/AmiB activator)
VTPPPDEDREIIVEEARGDGWTPAAESKDIEETPTRFRCRIAAPKGVTTKASLVLERTDRQSVSLSDLGAEEILARIQGLDNESAVLKDTAAKLSALVTAINHAKSQRAQLDAERKRIAEDQERIRRNLQSVGASSDLGRRYLATLQSQEDRLAEIERNDAALADQLAATRKSAAELARQLVL